MPEVASGRRTNVSCGIRPHGANIERHNGPRPQHPAPSHQEARAAPILIQIQALRGRLRPLSCAPPLAPVFPPCVRLCVETSLSWPSARTQRPPTHKWWTMRKYVIRSAFILAAMQRRPRSTHVPVSTTHTPATDLPTISQITCRVRPKLAPSGPKLGSSLARALPRLRIGWPTFSPLWPTLATCGRSVQRWPRWAQIFPGLGRSCPPKSVRMGANKWAKASERHMGDASAVSRVVVFFVF